MAERPGATVMSVERVRSLLWSNIDRSGGPYACWPWLRKVGADGYGRFTPDRSNRLVHRMAYEAARGPIADGLVIDHLCRNRRCANPNHLEPVSQRVNTLRGVGPAAVLARRQECAAGHPFDGEARDRGRTYRRCLTCQRETVRRYRSRLAGGAR